MANNYEQLAADIMENVGGIGNVKGLTHCATRLRFKLADEGIANDEAIEGLKGVVKLIKSGGQYQVVIGPAVTDVYDQITPMLASNPVADVEEDAGDGEKRGPLDVVIDFLTSALGPVLGVMCAGGIIKGLVSLLSMMGMIADGELIYELLNAAGDATYFFMPALLGYSLSKRLKVDPIVGIVLGAALVYPDIQNIEGATLFGIDYSGVSYTSTMFPMIFVMLATAPLDHWLNKVLPASVKSFLKPALDLLIMLPLGYLVIGPVANMLSFALGNAISSLYGISPALCGFVLCGVEQILVMFGIHMGLGAIIFAAMFAVGSSPLYPMLCIPWFSQLGICLAAYLRTKDEKVKEIALPAAISSAFGITEPAIYGLTLPRIKYFVISCVVSALAGIWVGMTGVTAYQLGGSGFLALTIVMNEADPASLINFAIAIAFNLVVNFAITMVIWNDKRDAKA